MMPAVLAGWRKPTPFVILKGMSLLKEKLLVDLYLNVMRKGGSQN
jgi:hypothetical protein